MATSGGIDFDFSGLNRLAADFKLAALDAVPDTIRAVEVTARHIRDDWRDEAEKSNPAHAPAYPFAVDYDMELETDGVIAAEIGPNLARNQGALGILEDAPGGVKSAPQRSRDKAVRKNLADFEKGLLKATEGKL